MLMIQYINTHEIAAMRPDFQRIHCCGVGRVISYMYPLVDPTHPDEMHPSDDLFPVDMVTFSQNSVSLINGIKRWLQRI